MSNDIAIYHDEPFHQQRLYMLDPDWGYYHRPKSMVGSIKGHVVDQYELVAVIVA